MHQCSRATQYSAAVLYSTGSSAQQPCTTAVARVHSSCAKLPYHWLEYTAVIHQCTGSNAQQPCTTATTLARVHRSCTTALARMHSSRAPLHEYTSVVHHCHITARAHSGRAPLPYTTATSTQRSCTTAIHHCYEYTAVVHHCTGSGGVLHELWRKQFRSHFKWVARNSQVKSDTASCGHLG